MASPTAPLEATMHRRSARLCSALLLPLLCLLAPALAAATALAPSADPVRRSAQEPASAEHWARLHASWLASADFSERLEGLAATPEPMTTGAESMTLARARLTLNAQDLSAHRLLARDGADPDARAHAQALDALLEATLTAGDGSRDRPWPAASRGDARALLAEQGLQDIGGLYTVPAVDRLVLQIDARPGPGTLSRTYHFDLSTALRTWRRHETHRRPGVPVLPEQLVEQLAAAGDSFAMASVAIRIAQNGGSNSALQAGLRLQDAIHAGNGLAWALLGDLYARAQARDASTDTAAAQRPADAARTAYDRGARAGVAYAVYQLGMLALEAGDRNTARPHLEQAAAAGQPAAQRQLAWMLRTGDGIDADLARATGLLRAAARSGDPEGRYEFARWRLLETEGIETDADALAALDANVSLGHARSIALLGDLYARGRHRPLDPARAHQLWLEAAALARDLETIQGIARALIANRTGPLHDAKAASALMERLFATRSDARRCVACYATWVEALLAAGRIEDAHLALMEALARVDRLPGQAAARTRLEALARQLDEAPAVADAADADAPMETAGL
jgi:TPR repeat protein